MVKYNRIARLLKLPILSVAVLSGFMFYLGSMVDVFQFDFEGQTVLSALLFTAGLVLIAMAGKLFRKVNTTVNPLTPEKTSQLVTSGLYRFSRNPMYVGFWLWLLAIFVLVGNGVNAIFMVLFVWIANWFYIAPEERALEMLFGANYLAYKQKVRRWV